MIVSKKTMIVCAACAVAASAVFYLAFEMSPEVSPPRPATLAEIQKRREMRREAEPVAAVQPAAVQSRATAPPGVPPPDRWSGMKDPTERSMIGLPFQVSESVNVNCKKLKDWSCARLNVSLQRMAAESRDVEWAPRMEARIERAAYEGERGQYRIRALECRSTRCALEVATESKIAGISFNAAGGESMLEFAGMFGVENDPQTGIRTMVFVQVWQKRAAFLAERNDD